MKMSALSSYVSSWYGDESKGPSVGTRADNQSDSISPSLLYGLMGGRRDSSSSSDQLGIFEVNIEPNSYGIIRQKTNMISMLFVSCMVRWFTCNSIARWLI